MAVTDLREIWESRRGRITVDGQREYTRVFRAVTNNAADNVVTVKSALEVVLWEPHPEDPAAFAVDVNPRNIPAHPRVWIVDVTYSNAPKRRCDTTGIENPLDEPPEIDWDQDEEEIAIDKADKVGETIDGAITTYDPPLLGVPETNSAGEPFDPPRTRRRAFTLLSIGRNEAAYNSEFAEQYAHSINDDTLTICGRECAPFTVLLRRMRGSKRYRGSCAPYYRVNYELAINRKTWITELYDAGHNELVTIAGEQKLQRITDKDGVPAQGGPWPLNGAGGAATLPIGPGNPAVFLRFREQDALPFSALNLPEDP